MFGVALSSLTAADDADRDARVPRVLRRCLDVLDAPDVVSLHGLFRISGDSREINELKVKLDVGEPVDLQAATPHSVAGTAQDVAEGAAGAAAHIRPVRAHHCRSENLQQQQQQAAIFDSVNALLERLPAAHRATLDALLPFLHRVSARSSVNLMTASNIAICFSPNILRPRIETLESVARDTPIAIAAITALIQHSNSSEACTFPAPQQPVSPTSPTTPTAATSGWPVPTLPPPIPASRAQCRYPLLRLWEPHTTHTLPVARHRPYPAA